MNADEMWDAQVPADGAPTQNGQAGAAVRDAHAVRADDGRLVAAGYRGLDRGGFANYSDL
jgi:hypothetical protein